MTTTLEPAGRHARQVGESQPPHPGHRPRDPVPEPAAGAGQERATADGGAAGPGLPRRFGLGARHITVSTVGLIPGIRDFATRPLPVNLAVSLHAANDTLRDELKSGQSDEQLTAVPDAETISIEDAKIAITPTTMTRVVLLPDSDTSAPVAARVSPDM